MQHLIRQNATISSHTENFSLGSLKRLNNLRRHAICLNNRQPQLKRLGLNRRRLQLFTTPTNSIRASNNKRNLIPSLNKRSQRRHSKIGRTHKHNTHKSKSPLNNEPRRLQKSVPGRKRTQPQEQFNKDKYTQKQRKSRIKAALPTKHLSAKTPFPGPTAPGRTELEQRSPRC